MSLVPYDAAPPQALSAEELQYNVDALAAVLQQYGPQRIDVAYRNSPHERWVSIQGQVRLRDGVIVFRYLDVWHRPNGNDILFPVPEVQYSSMRFDTDVVNRQFLDTIAELSSASHNLRAATEIQQQQALTLHSMGAGLHSLGERVDRASNELTQTAFQAQAAAHQTVQLLGQRAEQANQQIATSTQQLQSTAQQALAELQLEQQPDLGPAAPPPSRARQATPPNDVTGS